MSSLSVVMIVKNEALVLDKCLEKVKAIADEIIVVDSASEDDTVAIAGRYGAKVFVEKEWHGYGIQRQIAQSHASKDWIFMLDADEIITADLQEEIQQVVKINNQNEAWNVPRLSWVFGRFIRHSGWYPDYVLRLYPANKGSYNDSLVHEKVKLDNAVKCKKLEHHLEHYTYKDLNDYLVKSANYAKAWSLQRLKQGKKSSISKAIVHGVACFIKMYLLRLGFLDGKQGFILALLSAHSTFVKYIDLWEKSTISQQQKT